MFVNTLEISKRKNLGNYEHLEVKIGLALTEDDDFNTAYSSLMGKVEDALNGKQPEAVAPTKKKESSPSNAKKKASPPAKKKKKEEVTIPTIKEMTTLCRDTAGRLKSGEKVKFLIKEVCGVDTLKEASEEFYVELSKKLKDA